MNTIIPNLSNAEYHARPAANASGLKLIARSPLHYWSQYIDPDRVPREETKAMTIGTAVHAALLEPALFAKRYVQIPEGLDRRTKEGKALWAEIEASGRAALSASDYDDVCAAARSGRSHPVMASMLALGGVFEQSIFSTDPETGALCKIRPDYAIAPCAEYPSGLIVDVKTTEDASNDAFVRSIWSYAYSLQAAFYVDTYQRALGLDEPPAFVWLVIEKSRPFACVMYSADDDMIAFGRRQYEPLLALWQRCMSTGDWPGYSIDPQSLVLPAWAARQVSPNDSDDIEVTYAE